ncbi:MAG TPA: cell division protein ZipA C-terminal FtsZ-binding domain-containing protein [Eoetvoesiella sp.]|uniref:cell division protein ZipA C-terminal FtsZ-binding domain-containing protein n=1 Tax=Eoetvoesiella sp. TaxID=1966355 RepID=UPI002C0E92C0|nr:cell division protein ZipA C-terminal FtsZ-binding domain-containing protein [Eoetvoesiella sp.]HWK61185.1 cell division protein ZipA C-terminal FtsZ-binding domain-containing protein [Eoetvoesiella sp.]
MSELQIGLISLGVVLIVVVLCFNWWQDRRVRQRMQEHFPEGEHDPLMGGVSSGRREPGMSSLAQRDGADDEEAEADPTCEAVIDIGFAQPVPGLQLYQAIRDVDKVGGKPVRVFATHDGNVHRMRLREDESYDSLQLAVLLANRSGALTDIEWSHLWAIAQSLAERFDGSVEGPEQAQVLARARELDALCADLDATVGLTLKLRGTQPVADVAQVLKNTGFLPYGRQMAWMSDSGVPRFTVLFDGLLVDDVQSAGVDKLDLLLDLPNSPSDEQAFSRMASVGRDLAARLDAELIDDQGRPLADGADHTIDAQLFQLYAKLESQGFPACDARTVRLFS